MSRLNLIACTIAAASFALPGAGMAGQEAQQPVRILGQYFLSDDELDLAGGAVLYSDCTHDGSVIAAIPLGPQRTVAKLTATYWVNNPDSSVPPYSFWQVPDVLKGVPRLFLCYDFALISGLDPGFREFCDWAPRDRKRPLAVDFDGDDVRDLLISVQYRGGPWRCTDRRQDER